MASIISALIGSFTKGMKPLLAFPPSSSAFLASNRLLLATVTTSGRSRGGSVHQPVAECVDGGVRLLLRAHLDEAEALRAARVGVHDDLGGPDRPVRLEQLFQATFRETSGQV